MRLVCISDTHSLHHNLDGQLPDGDVLIHAGDFCGQNSIISADAFLDWFADQPHKYKVFIAGNHDGPFEKTPDWVKDVLSEINPPLFYLQDSGIEIEGVKFFGEP